MSNQGLLRRKATRWVPMCIVASLVASSFLVIANQEIASAVTPTITEASGFPVSADTGPTTMSINPRSVGDLVIFQSQIHSTSITVTGVSSSGTGPFQLAQRYVDPNGLLTEEIWWAVATSTGSTTITASYSQSVASLSPAPQLIADSFTTSVPSDWGAVISGGSFGTGATAIAFPSLTSSASPSQLYWGYVESATGTADTTSPSTGFTDTSVGSGNVIVSNDSLSASTAYAPTDTQAPASNYTAIGSIFEAAPRSTVTFNANLGSGSMSPEVASAPTALTTNTFARTYYSFAGWNTAADGSGTAYADGATYPFSADTTLYAQWSPNNHTVTFNGNQATSGTMVPQVTIVPTALTGDVFARTYYTFAGWNTAANGLGTAYAAGATYSFSADTTLYAQWTPNNHTVTFNGNQATGGTMSPQVTNVPTALTSDTFTRTGYNFEGWNSAANGLGTSYADGVTYSFGANIILYAQWTLVTHTVTFIGNSDTSGSMSPEVSSAPTTLSSDAFVRSNYTFAGWNTAANGSGTAYADGTTYPFSADVTLYAQWKAIVPHAQRVVGYALAGKSRSVTIVGSGFTNRSKVSSNAKGVKVRVVHARANRLVLTVIVGHGVRPGHYTFSVTTPGRKLTKIRFVTK